MLNGRPLTYDRAHQVRITLLIIIGEPGDLVQPDRIRVMAPTDGGLQSLVIVGLKFLMIQQMER